MDLKLKIVDSILVDAGKADPGNYLQTYSDTLHDYLNIYFQKKDKKAITILRLNKKFELVATIENVDVARLNNTAMFSSENFYFKNNVYSLKTESDTSGKQFYLNKYCLKSETQNFDYEFKWQFPFERKNIHSAHIFYSNKDYVLLFVVVNSGIKAGQWVLKINAETGKLEKGTKINDKGETNSYLYGASFIDKNYKSISLVGQKFSPAQFQINENKLSIANAAFTTLYYAEIDSSGEITLKQDFKVPVNDLKTGMQKTSNSFLLRLSNLSKKADGSLSFEGDVFKGANSNLCYLYANTTQFNIVPIEDKLALEKNSIGPNLLIADYFVTLDKLDMNGKLCMDSVNQFEKLFYKPLTFPVKQQFKLDDTKNPVWILSKHTNKKNEINFSFLSLVNKVYKVSPVEVLNEVVNPVFIALTPTSFIIASQIEDEKYQLKLFNW